MYKSIVLRIESSPWKIDYHRVGDTFQTNRGVFGGVALVFYNVSIRNTKNNKNTSNNKIKAPPKNKPDYTPAFHSEVLCFFIFNIHNMCHLVHFLNSISNSMSLRLFFIL